MLIDEIKLELKAGKGGNGVVRWRREKFRPKGGPSGGNGGNGGDIYVEAVSDLAYLRNYRFKKKHNAMNGEAGGKNSLEGRKGDDLIIQLPVGSVIKREGYVLEKELTEVGQRILLLKGGRGGLGNEHFKSSRNVNPYESTAGRKGDAGIFEIELRLIADIGLVGLPSCGKSTLLNALTNAKSKVAAYHFTTLEPHLGILPNKKILADIPGLIEGASEGKGLGHKFLKHIKRTKEIWHLVSAESENPLSDYRAIRKELEKYDPKLGEKDEKVILSKSDLLSEADLKKIKKDLKKEIGKNIIAISAYDDESLKQLLE